MVWWEAILAYVGGPAVALGAIGFLVKYLLDKSFERDKEKRDEEAEKFRHELKLISVEHGVRFGELHGRRAESILEIYRSMVDTRQRLVELVESFQNSEIENSDDSFFEVLFSRVAESFHQLDGLATHNLLYFNESTACQIRELILAFQSIALRASDAKCSARVHSDLSARIKRESSRQITDLINEQILPIEAALAREFRNLLGVESSGLV